LHCNKNEFASRIRALCVESGKIRDLTHAVTSALRRFPAAALLALSTLFAACSGSVGPSPNVVDPQTITVQPSALVIYPGVPATLLITGGTGSYVVASNNQSTVPIVSAGVGHQLTVIANPVNAETVVTLSIRDTGTTTPVTATLTVRPGTIANSVTVAPVGTDCNTTATPPVVFLCAGGEALVTTTISQGGVILPARGVRFDVVSGDVRFIVTPPGATGESLATTTTAVSDQNGIVRVRVRALPGAAPQNALIQITDPETLAFQRVVVPITQAPGPGGQSFFAIPTSTTYSGPFVGQCATNPSSDVVVFGGTPPYNIVSGSGSLVVSPSVVNASGSSFRVTAISGSQCFTNVPVTITDASGRTISVTFTNQEGTAAQTPVTIAPTTFALSCGGSVSFTIGGGTPPFSVGSTHPRVVASVSGRTVTATRVTGDAVTTGQTSGAIGVSDGNTTATATSTATGIPPFCP
jgi:hypothetical protein